MRRTRTVRTVERSTGMTKPRAPVQEVQAAQTISNSKIIDRGVEPIAKYRKLAARFAQQMWTAARGQESEPNGRLKLQAHTTGRVVQRD